MARGTGVSGGPAIWHVGDKVAPSGPHLAVVPGEQVPLLPLDLPDKLRGMARERVAERQMVELLSAPSENFEMRTFVSKASAYWSRALVADSGLASAWRNGLHPGCIALLPDYLTLPVAEGLWTLDLQNGVLSARVGVEDGFSAEPDLAQVMLAQLSPPKAVLRTGEADEALDAYLATLNVPLLDDPKALKKAGFNALRWNDAVGGIDLKDPPSAVYDRLRDKIMRWQVPAVFAALTLGVWLATMILQTQNLHAEADRAKTLTRELVREHFVPSGPILDIRAQVTAAAAQAADPDPSGTETLPALTQLQIAAPVLTVETLLLQAATFRSDTGLVAVVEAADFATLDQLVSDLKGAGFDVGELDSRAQQSGGVVARLRLELLP